MRSTVTSMLGFVLALAAVASQASNSLTVHPLDANDLGSGAPWQFLSSLLHDVDVVALPEPIHMTHEFPIVRLGAIKSLNEQNGFHLLAMEGSAIDAWATQDRFIASAKTDRDAADAQLALFPLWNTPEIQQLFQYEAASWATPAPFYITAYDVQPGSGKGTYGVEAFRLLADRLTTYAQPPTTLTLETWLTQLAPLTGGCRQFTLADVPAVRSAVEPLESWISTAVTVVATRVPSVPMHAAALRLLPANLRGSLALCQGMAAGPQANYKALRDREGAAFAEMLRNSSANKKLILWAHWSHLTYRDARAGVSVGQELREKLGTRLYTILPIAERGSAIVIFPNRGSDEDIGFSWIRSRSDPFSKKMQGLSPSPFFLDLRDPVVKNDDALAGLQEVWIESRPVSLSLLQDTDAIVWLKRVGPPQLPLPMLLILGGMHYRTTLAVSVSFLAIAGVGIAVWRWRRRRSVHNVLSDPNPSQA